MSTDLGIAGVTRALRNLLGGVATADYSALPEDTRPSAEIRITTLPPDRVRNGDNSHTGNQINLFLYHTEPSAAYRNMDMPRRVRPGETGHPPLALSLYYLLTAYGESDSELIAQTLLGASMRVLHDHPLLSREELGDALPGSGLDSQFERIRITPQPVSLDEVSKLWTGFQSEYRLSAAYHASVVLIESQRPSRTPLPVLRRGETDRGVAMLAAPGPTLLKVGEIFDPALPARPRYGKPAAELGDVLVLEGTHLAFDPLLARFRRIGSAEPAQPLPMPLLPERSATEVRVALPASAQPGIAAQWPAGLYTVELWAQRPDLPAWCSNRLAFALAPTLESIAPAAQPEAAQPFDLAVTCRPQIAAGQQVALVLGDRELAPSQVTTPAGDPDAASSLLFAVEGLVPGDYVVRLRVDGAESVPIDFTADPLSFDAGQTVTISP